MNSRVDVDFSTDCKAGVVESVYTRRLKRLALKWLAGSSPAARTMKCYFRLDFARPVFGLFLGPPIGSVQSLAQATVQVCPALKFSHSTTHRRPAQMPILRPRLRQIGQNTGGDTRHATRGPTISS